MWFIIIRQVLNLIGSFFVLTLFTFGLTYLFPQGSSFIFDSPISNEFMANGTINQATDANFFIGYYQYLTQILNGNFGLSSVRGSPIFFEFLTYFPATIELSMGALIFALGFGIPLGIIAAKLKNQWQDKLIVSSTLVGFSMPIFWWAMLLVLLFSLWLGITPVASRLGFEFDIQPVTGFMLIDTLISPHAYNVEAFYDAVHHLILPSVVLGTIPLAVFTRTTRSAMISELSKDYIQSAKARGISQNLVVWKHALRNAIIPILTVLGLQVSVLITGSLITETIFSWPGVGKWMLEAVYRRDFPVIHGGILAIASFVIVTHLLIDLVSLYFDPKKRTQ